MLFVCVWVVGVAADTVLLPVLACGVVMVGVVASGVVGCGVRVGVVLPRRGVCWCVVLCVVV